MEIRWPLPPECWGLKTCGTASWLSFLVFNWDCVCAGPLPALKSRCGREVQWWEAKQQQPGVKMEAERTWCRCSPNGCLPASPSSFSAISKQKGKQPFFVCVCTVRIAYPPSPNHHLSPQLLLCLRLSWRTLHPTLVLACPDHGRTLLCSPDESEARLSYLAEPLSVQYNLQDDSEQHFEFWPASQGWKGSPGEKVSLPELGRRWVRGWGRRIGEGKQGEKV